MRGKVVHINAGSLDLLAERMSDKGLLVDAILGTGLKTDVRGLYADVITLMNSSGLPVVAIDTPSGLDTDLGRPLGMAVQAEMTVALGYPKVGQVIYPGVKYVGELVVADIGIVPQAEDEVAPKTYLLEREELRWLVPRRDPDSHKGTYGHLLAIAGSRGKTGAAILACRGAMRAGAGLVTLAASRSLNNILAGSLVEVMTDLLNENEAEEMEPPSEAQWQRMLERKSALLFGPGIGVTESTHTILRWLLRNLDIPWVIDADGLNNLALELDQLRHAKRPPVLTPHPGEMARLLGVPVAEVNENRVDVARSFAMRHLCHVVLKGAHTVIALSDGRVFINPSGNPGMASGGMGDVLAGMLGALLGQNLSVADALRLGVFLHGFVGDRVAAQRGEIGLIASDIIEGLPRGLRELSEDRGQNAKCKMQNANFRKENRRGIRKF